MWNFYQKEKCSRIANGLYQFGNARILGRCLSLKKLFIAIRKKDFVTVRELLERKPELISCVAKQPPKKDDGQSPLQVAVKTGSFEIAEDLLNMGADVNFMEKESCNDWKAPVIHDAIRASVMTARFTTRLWNGSYEIQNTKEKADCSFKLLKRMFDLGADINARDSYGNSCLHRAILDARQILPNYNHVENRLMDNRLLNDDVKEDLIRIFNLLLDKGADIQEVDPKINKPLSEFYAKEPVAQFFYIERIEEKS